MEVPTLIGTNFEEFDLYFTATVRIQNALIGTPLDYLIRLGPALSTRGNLVPWSAPVAQGHPRNAEHRYLPYLRCYETPKMMGKE